MVKYYGRARQRIGSVNTNQIGLNMSGCPSKVGRQGYLSRYIARRAQCNQKFCGPVYYHGVLWSWNSGRCVTKAPRGQSFNSGVGHKSTPRFACGDTCAAELTLDAAFDIIFKYFSALVYPNGYVPVLVGTKETLKSDLGDAHDALLNPIQHLEPGNTYYDQAPPAVKKAILSVNSKDLTFKIKGNLRKHIVGLVTLIDKSVLYDNGFGIRLKLSPTSVVVAFGDGGDDCGGIADSLDEGSMLQTPQLCKWFTGVKKIINSSAVDARVAIAPNTRNDQNKWNPHCGSFGNDTNPFGFYDGPAIVCLPSVPGDEKNMIRYEWNEIWDSTQEKIKETIDGENYVNDDYELTKYENIIPINCSSYCPQCTNLYIDIILSIRSKTKLTSSTITNIESVLGTEGGGEQIKLGGPNELYANKPKNSEYVYYVPLATGKISWKDHYPVLKNVTNRKTKQQGFYNGYKNTGCGLPRPPKSYGSST